MAWEKEAKAILKKVEDNIFMREDFFLGPFLPEDVLSDSEVGLLNVATYNQFVAILNEHGLAALDILARELQTTLDEAVKKEKEVIELQQRHTHPINLANLAKWRKINTLTVHYAAYRLETIRAVLFRYAMMGVVEPFREEAPVNTLTHKQLLEWMPAVIALLDEIEAGTVAAGPDSPGIIQLGEFFDELAKRVPVNQRNNKWEGKNLMERMRTIITPALWPGVADGRIDIAGWRALCENWKGANQLLNGDDQLLK